MISESQPPATHPKRRRKLTIQDADAIAKLIVKQKCTETDAAITLGINVGQWFSWKSKAKRAEQFASTLTRIREVKLSGFIDRIESAGDDYEIQLPNGKVINKKGDWRALAWLADKEKRFQPESSATPATVSIQIGLVHDQLKRVIGFANESLQPLLPAPVDNVADDDNGQLKSNLNKIKMPVRRKVE
jgi:hypothetical protein